MINKNTLRLFCWKEKVSIMKKNMGTADRIVRVIIAAVIATLFFADILTGALGIVLLVVAGIFVLTSLVSFCPLYTLFGFKTFPGKEKE